MTDETNDAAFESDGAFWLAENPDVKVRGHLKTEAGKYPEVALDNALVDDPRVRPIQGGLALSGSAADNVAAFLPITLHGQLDSGELITLLHAQNHGGDGSGLLDNPHYKAHNMVSGAHVNGEDQLFTVVRFRLGHPDWLAHLTETEPVTFADDNSTLTVETSDGGNWLVYSSSTPATLRQLEIRVISGCLVLLDLAFHRDLKTHATQLRIAPDSPWLPVQGPALNAPPAGAEIYGALLPREVLTVERFARWIAINDELDGLAWAAAHPVKAALQTQALVATSLVEGLHRRMPYAQSKFPDLKKADAKRILDAAREAAGAQADQQGLDRKRVIDSILFLHEVSFLQRATDVVAEVCDAIPEIVESVPDLPKRLRDVRNDMSHQLRLDDDKVPLQVRYLRWLIVAATTPWLLRALLLLRVGVHPEVLRAGYLKSNRFDHFRANTAQHVKELDDATGTA